MMSAAASADRASILLSERAAMKGRRRSSYRGDGQDWFGRVDSNDATTFWQ